MHICGDEIMAVSASIPFVGGIIIAVRHYFHRVFHGKDVSPKDDGCCKDHDDHSSDE